MGDGKQNDNSGVVGGHQVNIGEMRGNIGQIGDRYEYHQHARPYRPPFQLPPRPVHFTGRADLLATLRAQIHPDRDITLHGPGGIGKTALAAEALWRLEDEGELRQRFPDGVIFHSFYGQPTTDEAFQQIAISLGEENLQPNPAAAARRALGGRKVLVVLDGAEEAERLDRVRDIAGRCGIVVTTRDRKQAQDTWLDIGSLSVSEGLALIQEWAGEYAEHEEAARQICELVGGLPLAVRLVGRYLAQNQDFAPSYLSWLQQTPLAALDYGERREESVPVLLDKSLEQVSPTARDIVAIAGRLSLNWIPVGAFVYALGYENLHELRPGLDELSRHGLLRRSGDFYELTHALIHTYSGRRVSVSPDTLERLAQFFADLCRQSWKLAPDAYPVLAATRPHVMALIPHLQKVEKWDAMLALAWGMWAYLNLQGYIDDELVLVGSALRGARESNRTRDEESWLTKLGNANVSLDRYEDAIVHYEDALAINQEHGVSEGVAGQLSNLGVTYRRLGLVKKAIDLLKQALATCEDIGDREGQIRCLGNLGNICIDLGQVEQATDYCRRALAISREIGARESEGTALNNLGNLYAAQDRFEESLDCQRQALAISREIGHRRDEIRSLDNLGVICTKIGRMEEAIDYLEQALALKREIGNRHGEAADLGALGIACAQLGRVEEAMDHYEQALAITRKIGDRRGEGEHLGNLGNAYLQVSQVKEAITYYEQALETAREVGDRRGEGTWLGNLGNAYTGLGRVEEAIGYYEQALAISREIGDRRDEGAWLGNRGNTYLQVSQVKEAITYYSQALEIAREVGDRLRERNHLGNLGLAYAGLGRVEEAIGYCKQSLVISREIGDRRDEGNCLYNLGLAYRDQERLRTAIDYMERALAVYESLEAADDAADARARLEEWRGENQGEEEAGDKE